MLTSPKLKIWQREVFASTFVGSESFVIICERSKGKIEMKWIKGLTYETAVDYEVMSSLLLSGIFSVVLIYVYGVLENIFLGLIINIIFYLFVAYSIYRKDKLFEETKEWLTLEAEVLNVKLVHRSCVPRKQAINYYPKVKYKYSLDGKTYITDNMYLLECNGYYWEDEAKELAKKFVNQKTIECFVNPKDHTQSFVIRNEENGSYFLTAIVMFFFSYTMIPVILLM